MPRIDTHLDLAGDEFRANREHMRELVADLDRRLERVREGGGPAQVERHRARGKLLARERIERLVDPGAAFLELSALAPTASTTTRRRRRGIVTGIAPVAGTPCVIVANDATVKGGTYYPITVKKHLRAQEIAQQNRCPASTWSTPAARSCRCRPTSSPTATTSAASSTTRPACRAAGIPQMAVVMGSCTAGGAYVPAMCDETVIVRGTGTIFLGGPPLVKAATGEEVTAEELGGGDVHARVSGVADHLADDDEHALRIAREIVRHLNRRPPAAGPLRDPEPPALDPDELHGVVPRDPRQGYDVREVIGRIVDGSLLHEFKALYGETLVCGFAHIHGIRSPSWPTTASCSRSRRSRARTSSSWPPPAASRSCSCRTSPASWSAASTRPAASPRTAPRW